MEQRKLRKQQCNSQATEQASLLTAALLHSFLGWGHTKETGNRNFQELLSAWVEHMLLNGAAQIEEMALQFPQFALLHSVTCVQLRVNGAAQFEERQCNFLNLHCSIQ
jgi:hypothetical protein